MGKEGFRNAMTFPMEGMDGACYLREEAHLPEPSPANMSAQVREKAMLKSSQIKQRERET